MQMTQMHTESHRPAGTGELDRSRTLTWRWMHV